MPGLLTKRFCFLCLCLFASFVVLGTVGCGPEDQCKQNGDCTSDPAYGKGFTCELTDGVRMCSRSCPASCKVDSECQKCSGGKTFCVEGVCNYQPESCPASCATDSDCGQCENGRTSCLSGVCAVPLPVCPSACQQDGDCKDCAGGNTFCRGGTCGPENPSSCPSSCTIDADCAQCENGNTSCTGGICGKANQVCPSSCTGDLDCVNCPADQQSCVSGICTKKAAPTCPASCTTAADCAPCAADRRECISGKCDKKPDPNCPATCSADADCSPCAAGSKECVNGTCSTKPTCPSTCLTDADCGPCATGKQTCVGGVCDAKPVCPSSCSTDADCGPCATGKQTCVNGVCDAKPVCPSSCSTDQECAACPANQQSCVSGKCTNQPPACPTSCSVNSDCNKCSNGNIACVSGKCGKPTTCPSSCSLDAECVACGGHFECRQSKCQAKNPPLTGPGQLCDSNNRCRNGDVCITISDDNKSYCFQDCSSNSNACAVNTPDGRTNCVPFAQDGSGNTVSVCMGDAKKGEACGYGFEAQAECVGGTNPPLYCAQNNTCKEAVLQTTAGLPCNKNGDNSDPRKLCDTTKNLVCNQTTGKCATLGFAKEGEECDIDGSTLGKIVLCDRNVANLSCINFNATEGIARCHITCNPTASGQCTHKTGLSCEALLSNGNGICMDKVCTNDSDCVFPTYTCGTLQSGGSICYPPLPKGPKKFAEICGSPARTKGCTASGFCLRLQGSTNGFCSIDCTTAGTTCPKAGSISSQCVSINANEKACMFPCGGAGQVCPTGLTCNSTYNLCLAP